jgi:hypothetical protein
VLPQNVANGLDDRINQDVTCVLAPAKWRRLGQGPLWCHCDLARGVEVRITPITRVRPTKSINDAMATQQSRVCSEALAFDLVWAELSEIVKEIVPNKGIDNYYGICCKMLSSSPPVAVKFHNGKCWNFQLILLM